MDDPGQDNLRGTKTKVNNVPNNNRARRPNRPEVLSESKKRGRQPTEVHIRVHDVIHDIRLLAGVLTAKVNSPGVTLTPTETCIRRNDHFTFCTLTCGSKADAKTLKNLIVKDRGQFTPLIDCSFRPFVAAEEERQLLSQAKADLRKKVEKEFDNRSEQVLRLHNQKLSDIQERIDAAVGNLGDADNEGKVLEEIEALEHKREELERQQAEFTAAVTGFQRKLASLLEEDGYQSKVDELRKQFGVECCRLEKALPMYARRQDILQLVQQNPVSILLAETGSGKSTQVVQYLMEAGLADRGTIVCTQPRKVAAVSLASHVAQEQASNVGRRVGYKAGSRVKTSPSTKVVYMTDHALLNECLADPDLSAFSCVVVDEAHERSLFTDLLLSMVKRCVRRRPELRVIVTSATIDPQVFVDFFRGCPIMRVSGRAFPVDVIWQDSASEENDFEGYVDAAVQKAVDIHTNEPPGDILVFLTSAVEINKCCELFQQRMEDRTDYKCFQLHGQLQANEQQKVFEPLGNNKRKIVFATNCAETSITIDGIKYVVDTGVAKEMRYDPRRNIRSLDVTVISQSSAEQRKGRAGRTAPGKCYRLYSEDSFQSMATISLPEILKTHLGHALLKLAELGVTPDLYDFVQSPSQESIDNALKTLHQLGAMEGGVITDVGRWIAKLPFDPKLGLMTLKGYESGLMFDSIVLATLVSAGSGLFYRGLTDEEHRNLDKSKLRFGHPGGDSITALQVYKAWQAVDEKEKNKWCTSNSVNAKVIRGVRDTVNEVCKTLKNDADSKIVYQFSEAGDSDDRLRKMMFQCNASHLCHYLGRQSAGYFAAQACRQVHVHPSSAVCSLAGRPQWLMYDQLLHTSRLFVTGVTPVEDAWVRQLSEERFGFDVDSVRHKTLQNVFTLQAGSHAFFALVGPRYSKLRQLQESWGAEDSRVVVIEASQERGEVQVFCTEMWPGVQELRRQLTQTAEEAVSELLHEVREEPIGGERSRLRVLLGQGASVTDLLMPHETRKVFIHKPSDDASEELIKQKFQPFGKIVHIKQFSGGQNWGIVIFQTPAQAKAAADASREDESNVGQLEDRRRTSHNADFKARLSWNRRRGRGFGFVNVSPIYLSKCLDLGSLNIDGNLVRIKLDRKKGESLYLTKLPVDVTEDLIKRTLLHALGEKEDAEDIVEGVSVPREAARRTDERDLRGFENEISRTIGAHLTASRVEVTVQSPRTEKTAMFTAEAWFSDPIEGLEACRRLNAGFTLGGATVRVEPLISASLRVSTAVHDACALELEAVAAGLRASGLQVSIREWKTKTGDSRNGYTVFIKADGMEDIVRARTAVNEVIRGEVLECNDAPAVAHLLTAAGRQMLREAERDTAAHVNVDNRLRTVSIHGTAAACATVRLMIDQYLQEVKMGTGEEVALRGAGRPPGLLKALCDRYGEDLDLLRQQAGLHSVQVNYHRHLVKLTGPTESVQIGRQALEAVERGLAATGDVTAEEDGVDCVACLCPIDKGQVYRLQRCAHPFCRSCVVRQITIAIKDHHFPVVCSHDGCNLPLAWRDFNKLSPQGHIKISELANASLSAFILANRDRARFCTTPDCPMAYRVTEEDSAEVFLCPDCGVRTCSACHQQAHDGLTCVMLRSTRANEAGDRGVDVWVSQDPTNRKACPKCRSPIQKTGGCNKMHCTACGAIFCWLCTRKFPTEAACYDHLTQNHGGIFVVQDLMH